MGPSVAANETERRKQVRLRVRADLDISQQKYEGRTYFVVKDPVSLRYYRFKEAEHFLIQYLDGKHTLDEAQKEFEKRYRPERLSLEDLETFGQQLLSAGLAQNESPQAGKQLFERRAKRRRSEWMQLLTNVLYIKIPVFDPEKLLSRLLPCLRWIFTRWFFALSVAFIAAAVFLVATHFELFLSRLPSYQDFFSFKNAMYLWVALGVVKVIHEFGHGLSCKAFGGEVHEMGFLLLCLSPAMYCNVSDAWTLPNKWHRIIISFAGIYVELMIAALATFVWWNSPGQPFVNNLALSLMVVCSVSTVLFNGNPLMRFDGYYVLADWIEIPNLRDRANRYLKRLALEHLLGIEVPPEPYMELWRRVLFVAFAVVSYVYRWVITFVILRFLATFLKPYKLEVLSNLLALFAFGSMIGWPIYYLIRNYNKRGRLPEMKSRRVSVLASLIAGLLVVFFLVPLPVTRVRHTGLVEIDPEARVNLSVEMPGILQKIHVKEGEWVGKDKVLAEFVSPELEASLEEIKAKEFIKDNLAKLYEAQLASTRDPKTRQELKQGLVNAQGELAAARAQRQVIQNEMKKLVLRAPQEGLVINLPRPDEIGKRWDKGQETPFCSLGSPNRLRILLPVPADDFDLIRDNKVTHKIPVTIRVQGRASKTWRGHVTDLPPSEARTIPPALATKGGGPLPTKTTADPKATVPQGQVFLVGIDVEKPDSAICPGCLAQVKVHCRYRTLAWWTWRTIAATFDIGLL